MGDYYGTLDSGLALRLASRSSYSSLIDLFYYLTTTQLRTQPCATRHVDKYRVGTPIRRSLVKLPGLLNDVTKMVTECLRGIKITLFG